MGKDKNLMLLNAIQILKESVYFGTHLNLITCLSFLNLKVKANSRII